MNINRIKQTFLLVTVAIALSLSWVGCGKKAAPVVIAGPPPSGPAELKLKWAVGSRIVQTMDIQQTSETRVPGMPEPMKQDMTMAQKYGRSVLKELPGGGHEVELQFISTRMAMSGAGQPAMAFDTSDKSSLTNPMSAMFQKIAGATVKFTLDASSEVVKVEGVDELQRTLGASAANDPMGMLSSMFSEEAFKNWMQDNKSLPNKAVQPGDTWPVQMEISMGALGTMIAEYTYTFKAWERRNQHNWALIELVGTLKSKPGQDLKISGMSVAIENGKSSGETWFDLEDGLFAESKIKQDMNMVITLPAGARGAAAGQPQKITTTLNQNITIKSELGK